MLGGDVVQDYFLVGMIDRFESIYSVLCRFASVNSLSGQAIMRLFKSQWRARKGFTYGLEHLGSVNLFEVERNVGATQSQIFEMFLVPSYTLTASMCPYLRFCPICMGGRKHYAIFQWERLINCPFHSVRLRAACDNCGSPMLYGWTTSLFDYPFCCPHCQASLGALQGRVGFFDVHSLSRSHAISSVYAKLRGVPSRMRADDRSSELSLGLGFVVFCPMDDIAARWYDMAELPLQGLSLDDVNWLHRAGYIQVRGLSKARRRIVATDTLDRSELVSDLLCCLKAILRNLRRIRRREQYQSLRSTLFLSDQELPHRRKEAYCLLLECWCGKALNGRYTYEGMKQTIEAWLDRQRVETCEPRCFLGVTPWLLMHVFCGQVVDTIATVSQFVYGPSELLQGFTMSLAIVIRKPMWYVALTVAPSVVSYRVIHHYQFPSSLWASCV